MQDLSKPVSDNFAELLGQESSQSGTQNPAPQHTGNPTQESPNA